MSRARALVDAVFGRRLLFRIWTHGLLLFAGILAALTVARFVLPGHDALLLTRSYPQLAMRLIADRLRDAAEPGRVPESRALARELAELGEEMHLDITAFRPDGRVLATTARPPLAPPTASERGGLGPFHPAIVLDAGWPRGRYLVGAFDGDRLLAFAVAELRVPSGMLPHAALIFTIAAGLALLFIAIPLSRSIARPVERLGRLARELGAGNLAVRASVGRRDEIGDLARSFNDMAAQIQRLRSTERELLADVSHELRTPLARIRVVLDLAGDAEPESTRRYLREIAADVAELEQLLGEIIASSRLELDPTRWVEARPPLQRRAVPVRDLLESSVERFRERWPARAISCRLPDEPLIVDGDPVLLRRALDNLVDNARKYSPEREAVELTAAREGTGADAIVRIEVVDRGIGIAADDRPKLFTPFFRADRSRARSTGGVGLGLTLARRIIEAHGGAVGFTSPDAEPGSRFWLVLPLDPTG